MGDQDREDDDDEDGPFGNSKFNRVNKIEYYWLRVLLLLLLLLLRCFMA